MLTPQRRSPAEQRHSRGAACGRRVAKERSGSGFPHDGPALHSAAYRVPAGEIEQVVAETIQKHMEIVPGSTANDVAVGLVRNSVEKVIVHPDRLVVSLIAAEVAPSETDQPEARSRTDFPTIAWSRPSAIRKREVLGNDKPVTSARPIRSEARTKLLKAVA